MTDYNDYDRYRQQSAAQRRTASRSSAQRQRVNVSSSRTSASARPQGGSRSQGYHRSSRSGSYGAYSGYSTQRGGGYYTVATARHRRSFPPAAFITLAILALAIIGIIFYFTSCSPVTITLDGAETQVSRNATIESVIEEAQVQTTPGRLLAIDGSTLDEAGGEAYTATLNGEVVAGDATVAGGDTLNITQGADVTETYQEVTTPIPAEEKDLSDETWGAFYQLSGTMTPGVLATRTGDISGITLENVIAQEPDNLVFSRFGIDTHGEKAICLTFDDGPWDDWTEQILDILKENGAHATFFIVGDRIALAEGGEDLLKRELAEGHQLCTHTYDHADGSGRGVNLGYMTAEEQVAEVRDGQQAIAKAIGQAPSSYMRAPGGNFTMEIAKNVSEYCKLNINWNVDTEDWSRPGSDAIVSAILSAEPGEVVLMHDGGGDRSETVEALRGALPQLKAEGYKFLTIDEMLAYRDE